MLNVRFCLVVSSLALGMIGAGTRTAAACMCDDSANPCGAFNSPTVFVGEVLTVQQLGDEFRHRMRVLRPLKGIATETADVWSDARSSCGLKLTEGDRYVIYTSASTGRMSIRACEPIVHLAAGEPEPELPPVPGRVYGRITRDDTERIRWGRALEPIPAVRVWLDLPSGRLSTLSDAWGRFTFADVPPGSYTIGVDAGQGLTPWMARPVEMSAADTCASSSIILHPSGTVSGRVTSADGQPAPDILLSLTDPGGGRSGVPGRMTNADGRFTFDGLNSGDYLLAVNTGNAATGAQPFPESWFGGRDRASASRIGVGLGEPTELPTDYVLPPKLPTRTFTMAVTCRDGSKPPFVSAAARAVDRQLDEDFASSKDGIATITLLRDRAYILTVAASFPQASDDPQALAPQQELPPVEIPAGTPGRHLALLGPFASCAPRP